MALLGARKEAVLLAKDSEGTIVEEFRALFTTRALADAEVRARKSMADMVSGFVTGKSGVRELAILIMAGMEADRRASGGSGEPVSFDDACDVIDLVGIEPTLDVVGKAIRDVMTYGRKKTPEQPPEGQPEEPSGKN